jgi:hypothetical protein
LSFLGPKEGREPVTVKYNEMALCCFKTAHFIPDMNTQIYAGHCFPTADTHLSRDQLRALVNTLINLGIS